MATPLAAIRAGARVEFVDCNREDLCMSFADFERQRRAAQAARRRSWSTSVATSRSTPSRSRRTARPRDLPARGLRPRPRRRLERPQAGELRRRRRVLAVRDQDRLDRRRRHARLLAARAARVRARIPQLRQADVRGPGSQLPDERVHRGARADPDRADGRDRRLEERGRPHRARSAVPPLTARAPGGDDSAVSTSTSCSTGSSSRPVASTTSPATGSWATR